MSRSPGIISQRRRVHLRPHARCDICDGRLLDNDQYIGLIGNASFTAFETGVPGEPAVKHSCEEVSCVACNDWRRACTVHPDCLQLFMRTCTARDALDRLWLARMWQRVPWTGISFPTRRLASNLPLACDLSALLRCADRYGLTQLRTLPVELLITIEDFSRPHLFWRCVASVDLATQLSAGTSLPLQSFRLSSVVSWDRGNAPVIAAEGGDDSIAPIIRLTIDSGGLRKLERLPERPPYEQRRFDESVFIVESQSHFGSTVAHFKNGLLHLALAGMEHDLQVWDAPTPPFLERSLVQPKTYTRFQTINLDDITGITFFLWSNKTLEVHAHSRRTPSAQPTFNRLLDWYHPVGGLFEGRSAWVYVPLSRRDPLTHFGCLVSRKSDREVSFLPYQSCFMIRTALGGETVVGRYQVEDRRFLLSDAPTNLIYSDGSGRFHPVHLMMPYSSVKSESEQTGTLVDPPSYPRPDDFPGAKWYFSSAPLENVSWIQLFYVEDGLHCRGLLLEYAGGGQRALGQCRLGVDQSKMYTRPSSMAFTNVTRPRPGSEKHKIERIEATKVGFDDVPEGDGSWSHFAMEGTLRFWFTYDEARLEVV